MLPEKFHPLLTRWFLSKYGKPTAVQEQAWRSLAAGRHVLASAPTGSGKTLAAFLDVLSQFASGELPPDRLSVLYVSPLKALNEDIKVNLMSPLRDLAAFFSGNGEVFPYIRVATRSGDTPPNERRRMICDPPAILCTTPESLAILLASKRGQELLSGIRVLIVDEIHAVLGSKRGSHLACSIGRLALLAGEFQRIGLSATVKPFSVAADFLGSRMLLPAATDGTAALQARYEKRAVEVVAPPAEKKYAFSVLWPEASIPVPIPGDQSGNHMETRFAEADVSSGRYRAVVDDIILHINKSRTTLVFADSRRRAERLASMINEKAGDGTAWAHHGSMSKDVRRAIETKLKEGRLPCVVATSSLELGIDVVSVDLVVLVGSPSRADQLLQRAGRAGHGVGLVSEALLYPLHGMDLLQAAAVVNAALESDIDEVHPPDCPLDVLAQTLLAMVLFAPRGIGELYAEVRSFSCFENLDIADFDAVLGMLCGRFEDTRVKELSGRLYLDEDENTVAAREGSAMLLYSQGGTIADKGNYALRIAGGGAKIGELDEEFVFERRIGNSFVFGAQAWRITSIGEESVEVVPLDRAADFMPFWKAEKAPRGDSAVSRMLDACELAGRDAGAFTAYLSGRCGFSAEAIDPLVKFLSRQRLAQKGVGLVSRYRLPVELFRDTEKQGDATMVVLHALRGLGLHEPLGLALAGHLEDSLGARPDVLYTDDAVILVVPLSGIEETRNAVAAALTAYGDGASLARAVRKGIEGTAAFGAAFRENAGRSLLLPRRGFGKRTPLWVTRLRSKRLFERVMDAPGFPVIKETWRSILTERFRMPELAEFARDLASGAIFVEFFITESPSVFSGSSVWVRVNKFLYEDDSLRGLSSLHGKSAGEEAISHALGSKGARPNIGKDFARTFGARLRRELPGWAPETAEALLDWVEQRGCIPLDEWHDLLAFVPLELRAELSGIAGGTLKPSPALARLSVFRFAGAAIDVMVRSDRQAAFLKDPARALLQWLSFYGPVPLERVSAVFGSFFRDSGNGDDVIRESLDMGDLVPDDAGFNIEGAAGPSICHADSYAAMLRSHRNAARYSLAPIPVSLLPLFIARIQGLSGPGESAARPAGAEESLGKCLYRLSCYPIHARLLETEIVPSRTSAYEKSALDSLLGGGSGVWVGAGKEKIALCLPEELGLVFDSKPGKLLDPQAGMKDFWSVKESSGLGIGELSEALWNEIWHGQVSSDSFESVRRFLSGERPAAIPAEPRRTPGFRMPLAVRERWKAGTPMPGRWFSLFLPPVELDEADELDKAAALARILGRRYGLITRALCEREMPAFAWSAVFPALRRLELSGELVSGCFFSGLEGAQFLTQEALGVFRDDTFSSSSIFMNACDPASPCGIVPEASCSDPEKVLAGTALGVLPSRLPANRVFYDRGTLVASSKKDHRDISIVLKPGDAATGIFFSHIARVKSRSILPSRVIVEKINGIAASSSPFRDVMAKLGFESDRGRMVLW